jgi:meso-butanediol dehydrogenase / (S,S)-butanediol dehydrogenase / diacetyl reductase
MTKPVAVITGGGSGIGRATAMELASRGYAVGVLDVSGPGSEAVARDIARAGGQAHAVAVDVTRADDVAIAIGDVVERLGDLEVAVACAGIVVMGEAATMDLDEWRRAFSVNLDGVMHTARAAIPLIQRGGRGGAFVAVASDAGVLGATGWSPYVASKHAVVGLVRCMALDYGPENIRCNIVAPAFVDTPMTDRIFAGAEAERPHWEQRIPLRRFAAPEEVAKAIAHLASSDASFTNGLVYMVDGGETAGVAA